MTSRRIIKGVLHNFLGTYTSRYSGFDGYWVFGFLVEDLKGVSIDLLDTGAGYTDVTPSVFIRRLAVLKFGEQIAKAGLPKSYFREARLDISKSSEAVFGAVNVRGCSGYIVKFVAHVVSDLGRPYEATRSVFVAPHDPTVESRSARAG